ncbi:hypothetical protein HK104_007984 [Borealophlyctis nickersoniae]|nr:hypothetical protein HK104_007984 [Borealophlyctis nickersoniae]
MTETTKNEIPLHTLDLEQILDRTCPEYPHKKVQQNGGKLTFEKYRLLRLKEVQRKGLFETAEGLLDLNNVLDFLERNVNESVAKRTKGKKTKGEKSTYSQYINNIIQLLWFVTPDEVGMTTEQLSDLRRRGYKESRELNQEYALRRAKGEKSEYEKKNWIPDWKEFENQVEQSLNNTDKIYRLPNPTPQEIFEHQQRLQLYSVVRFYNTRSALRTVVLFKHPRCRPGKDNVLFWDAHGSMYICWNQTKSMHGAFIQEITDPLKSRLFKFIDRFRQNSLYLFPESKGRFEQKQDTYREALQSQAELVTGKRYGLSIMRKCQITAYYNGNLTPYEKERLSREFHHTAPEHELYVRNVPPTEDAEGAGGDEVVDDDDDLDDDLSDDDNDDGQERENEIPVQPFNWDDLDFGDLDAMDDIVVGEDMEE